MPMTSTATARPMNSAGQIIQIPNGGQAVLQAPATAQTVHIPGLGAVQVMNAIPLQTQFSANTQIVQASPQFTSQTTTQQALQQDPNDPSKWHVVQVATALPSVAQTQLVGSQTAQIMTANGNVIGQATIPNNSGISNATEVTVDNSAHASNQQGPSKTRLRRVACTCPNCKDGDRSRGK